MAKRVASFRELWDQPSPSSADVLDTLRDYARGGWAIKGSVVTELASRAQLSPDELSALGELAQIGVEAQALHPFGCKDVTVAREQAEYQHVIDFVAQQGVGE